jgi:CheY-like chemotaxis protein
MSEVLVLLVEDNPDDEKLALRALSQGKIDSQTMVVRDGQEALDYLFFEGAFTNREKINPQVILLDLKLPKVDGLEVLKRIRANDSTKLIPVVILTSSNEEKDIVASYGNGANSYLVKPVDMEKFTEAIHQFILYWVGLNKGLE